MLCLYSPLIRELCSCFILWKAIRVLGRVSMWAEVLLSLLGLTGNIAVLLGSIVRLTQSSIREHFTKHWGQLAQCSRGTAGNVTFNCCKDLDTLQVYTLRLQSRRSAWLPCRCQARGMQVQTAETGGLRLALLCWKSGTRSSGLCSASAVRCHRCICVVAFPQKWMWRRRSLSFPPAQPEGWDKWGAASFA